MTPEQELRFWSKVAQGEDDECWPWQATIHHSGYGHFRLDGRIVEAHRVAWESENGPTELDLLHSCDNKPCCNPAHLTPGTHAQNMQEAGERGRMRASRPGNGYTKINDEASLEIYRLHKGGMNFSELARRYGITQPTARTHFLKHATDEEKTALETGDNAVAKSMRKWARKPADHYPTPPAATVAILKHLDLPRGTWVADPACGRGDIIMSAAAMGYPGIATDLRHTGFGGGGIDFLDDANDWRWEGVELGLFNPPFNLAEPFIRKATRLFSTVAMLLKTNYWSAAKRIKLRQDCPPTARLDMTWRLAFLEAERGKSPLMDCTWFVWKQGDPPLPLEMLTKPAPEEVPTMEYPLAVHLADLRFALAANREARDEV